MLSGIVFVDKFDQMISQNEAYDFKGYSLRLSKLVKNNCILVDNENVFDIFNQKYIKAKKIKSIANLELISKEEILEMLEELKGEEVVYVGSNASICNFLLPFIQELHLTKAFKKSNVEDNEIENVNCYEGYSLIKASEIKKELGCSMQHRVYKNKKAKLTKKEILNENKN